GGGRKVEAVPADKRLERELHFLGPCAEGDCGGRAFGYSAGQVRGFFETRRHEHPPAVTCELNANAPKGCVIVFLEDLGIGTVGLQVRGDEGGRDAFAGANTEANRPTIWASARGCAVPS